MTFVVRKSGKNMTFSDCLELNEPGKIKNISSEIRIKILKTLYKTPMYPSELAGKLNNDTVVITQYSNLALDLALKKLGIQTSRVENGDRYVIEEMVKHGFVVGGEKTGHIILSRYSTTGDGIIAGLHLMRLLKKSGKKLSSLSNELEFYPQLLENVEVKEKKILSKIVGYNELITSIEKELGSTGRIFVRYSGTQNICRIMIEGKDLKQITEFANEMKNLIVGEIGV